MGFVEHLPKKGNCSSPPASGAVKDDLPVHRPAWR
jgi:hypothetical protein